MRELNYEDQLVISRCKGVVKDLIKNFSKYKLTSPNIVGLAKILHALTNYPNKVIDGYVAITTSMRFEGGGSAYTSFQVSDDKIELSTGGSVYNEGVGSDSFSDLFFSSNQTSGHDIELEIDNFFSLFYSPLNDTNGKLSIEDEATFLEEKDFKVD